MTKDLPDFLSEIVSAAVEAASFRTGLEADLPAAPAIGDIWLAYDTFILHVCFVPGVWKNINFLYLLLAGGTMTGAINMGGNKITSLADPTAAQDAATRAYVLAQVAAEAVARVADVDAEEAARIIADALLLPLTGGTMSGAIAMGTNKITGLGDPTVAQDAATRAWVLLQVAGFLLLTGGTMSGAIAMGNNKITGLAAPTAANDAVRKTYVDTKLATSSLSTTVRSRDTQYRNTSGKLKLVIVTVKLEVEADGGYEAHGFSHAALAHGPTSGSLTIVSEAVNNCEHVLVDGAGDALTIWGSLIALVPDDDYYEVETSKANDGETPVIDKWSEYTLF